MTRSGDEQLQERLGHCFHTPDLLERALTHSSATPEMRAGRREESLKESPPQDNERLEFLGDAVLELLTREYLVSTFPDWSEGRLSKSRARLVNAHSLAATARKLGLGEHLRLGRGEEKTGGREKSALLADAFEAVVAAVYLDAGLEAARGMLRRTLFEQVLDAGAERITDSDYKSALQEFLQGRGQPAADYRLSAETGPDHQKMFQVQAWLNGEYLAEGQGSTKKEAEQQAAQRALERFERAEAKG